MSDVYVSSAQVINDYRRRILAGEDLNKEELANAILALRNSRVKSSTAASETPRAKAKASAPRGPIDLNALFAKKETPQ